ncbi:MAG: hypothetical protein MZW92_29315 [Comamonadaceae bacterium]|nr:hypothetical protein [Comamonadaceae bacterium]
MRYALRAEFLDEFGTQEFFAYTEARGRAVGHSTGGDAGGDRLDVGAKRRGHLHGAGALGLPVSPAEGLLQ